jgi:hypothetical protein
LEDWCPAVVAVDLAVVFVIFVEESDFDNEEVIEGYEPVGVLETGGTG